MAWNHRHYFRGIRNLEANVFMESIEYVIKITISYSSIEHRDNPLLK